MVMFDIFPQGPSQGAPAKENHLAQAFLLHRPDPALRVGHYEMNEMDEMRE
jgi:hypothetical protein